MATSCESLETAYQIVDAIVPRDGNEADLKEATLGCMRTFQSYLEAMEYRNEQKPNPKR